MAKHFWGAILAAMALLASGPLHPTLAETAPAPVSAPALIPTADLAQLPLISDPEMSPNGTMLLGMLRLEGEVTKSTLGIVRLATGDRYAFPMSKGYEVLSYRWAGNTKVLISLGRNQSFQGSPIYVTRLLAYDVATRKSQFIGRRLQGPRGDDVLYVDPEGKWILLALQSSIYDWPSVYRVDLETGDMKEVVGQRKNVWEWFADGKGVVRAGIQYSWDKWSLFYRTRDGEDFRKIDSAQYGDDVDYLSLARFVPNSDEGYILSAEETGREALYRFNFATLTRGERVFENATNDISNAILTEDGQSLLAAVYTDVRDRVEWFDPALKALQADLDRAVAPREAWIVSRSRDLSRFLVLVTGPDDPGSYYMFMPDAGVMKRLTFVNEKLTGQRLTRAEPITYKARDGLEIHGYLTLPPGREAKNLPLIIMPHGGPFGVRDRGDYNAEVQLLANRGYAVLQPNYRGSDSYGRAFTERGYGQWGRAMQDDLDDGMDWLVKEGIADPDRVCIVGSSYGGYAALWGATRNPERYRCAASFAGVADLPRQMNYSRDFFFHRKQARKWKEKVKGEEDFSLKEISPFHQINRLQVPVLLAHGDDDQRVPPSQSIQFARALEKAGKPHELYLYPDEGHGFSNPAMQKAYFDQLEAFLRKHNPPD